MREQLTGDDLFAEILLLSDHRKNILLVEGPDDVATLDSHVAEEHTFVVPGYGKTSVQYAIDLCDARGINNVLAILDRDWVGIAEAEVSTPNVIYTDLYDLDATAIFAGDATKRTVAGLCDPNRVKLHTDSLQLAHIADIGVPTSAAIGVLRLVTKEQRLPLRLRDFPVQEILNLDNGAPDIEKMIVIAAARAASRSTVVDVENIASLVRARIDNLANPRRFCSGHDLGMTIATIMRKRWGCTTKADTVIKTFRVSFGCPELVSTSLYAKVRSWADDRGLEVWSCPKVLARAASQLS
ncbi:MULTISPECIES: hypothetical protein [Catenuloplanes]|uniref:DUF4435 domain-containing protein n=1 Tax=Catenuloplanes niger TaxID=587534 RepID=A0AAE4CT30_9ACTN|nr:hypothetical protein [Catenuloplanes niger]MDR7323650.1 hypothetical protein [Catenuloplanes niger]